MKIAMNSEMREADAYTINTLGVPGIVLMENAARAVADEAAKMCRADEKILLLAGKGNNGGDAFAAARLLINRGFSAEICFIGKNGDLAGDAAANYNICRAFGIKIHEFAEFSSDIVALINNSGLIIDALFGTGLSSALKEPQLSVVKAVNSSGKRVLAVDIPSGVSGDTGEILGDAVRAEKTVTLGLPKAGLYLYPGAEYSGEIIVADISIPKAAFERLDISLNTLTKEEARLLLPPRGIRTHKGSYGRLFVIAGSETMAGAASLCARSGYICG
ncbi:MAG: NAD(P)H-hydrate epimerase, partial [Firmicutes bacterium]|nr:NAD(P)H-hydrate epimerase [Bacillota bacterium]